MKKLLLGLAMMVLKKLMSSEVVHEELRSLALKSDNELDDKAVEVAIPVLRMLAEKL